MTRKLRGVGTVLALTTMSLGLAVAPAIADPCPIGPEGNPGPCVIEEPSMIMTMGHLCCWRMGLESPLGI
jgi:hypothetical protein